MSATRRRERQLKTCCTWNQCRTQNTQLCRWISMTSPALIKILKEMGLNQWRDSRDLQMEITVPPASEGSPRIESSTSSCSSTKTKLPWYQPRPEKFHKSCLWWKTSKQVFQAINHQVQFKHSPKRPQLSWTLQSHIKPKALGKWQASKDWWRCLNRLTTNRRKLSSWRSLSKIWRRRNHIPSGSPTHNARRLKIKLELASKTLLELSTSTIGTLGIEPSQLSNPKHLLQETRESKNCSSTPHMLTLMKTKPSSTHTTSSNNPKDIVVSTEWRNRHNIQKIWKQVCNSTLTARPSTTLLSRNNQLSSLSTSEYHRCKINTKRSSPRKS